MSDEPLHRAESAITTAKNISGHEKAELLGLLSRLKLAIGDVPHMQAEHAQSVARLAEVSAREATRKRPKQLEKALHELKQSVEKFEASHPDLVITVNDFATLLAEMGT